MQAADRSALTCEGLIVLHEVVGDPRLDEGAFVVGLDEMPATVRVPLRRDDNDIADLKGLYLDGHECSRAILRLASR